MSSQMGILYLADTNHVVAAFTRAAEPAQVETVPDSFVGAGYHIRPVPDSTVTSTDRADFVVSAKNLKFTEVVLDPAIVAAPRSYYMDTGTPPSPQLISNPASGLPVSGASPITLPNDPIPSLPSYALLVQLSSSSPTQYSSGPLNASANTTVYLSSLPPGTYHVLLCVPGYPLKWIDVSVS